MFFFFPCRFVLSPVHPMWQGPLAVPGGDRQSPIDIAVRKSVFDSELKPLVTTYDPKTCQQIWNNGYSFLVEYDDTTDKSSKLFENIETLTSGTSQPVETLRRTFIPPKCFIVKYSKVECLKASSKNACFDLHKKIISLPKDPPTSPLLYVGKSSPQLFTHTPHGCDDGHVTGAPALTSAAAPRLYFSANMLLISEQWADPTRTLCICCSALHYNSFYFYFFQTLTASAHFQLFKIR